ncbi:DNA-directed RNA polymerase III subunit RPC8-like [Rhopilema esculentum]|uniref:DNA-directed RNA polymerase III subunit RPC8-like n=1 Tax=Rhopilema esculentum TaxID=499914 RepID=UPI0031DE6DC1
MFVLAEMKDVVRIKPRHFSYDLHSTIAYELNKKLANKVVHEVGLCITLFDITEVSDSYILPGDGAAHTPVKFRYVVFRPFIDEVLVGKIKGSSSDGVQVSLGLFDDILIPAVYLQQKSKFDDDEQLWVWEYETDDGSHDLFMDANEPIRFRIIDEEFIDMTPSGPMLAGNTETTETAEKKKAPYSILASISEPGLGLLSWWNSTG